MPQSPYDPVAGVLAKAPAGTSSRADAWDAFHAATDENDLASRLNSIDLPDSVKADLWDLKATGRTKPVSAEDFSGPRGWPATLGDVMVGAVKGLGSSAIDLGKMAYGSVNPAGAFSIEPAAEAMKDSLAATNTGEKVGKGLETAAEFAMPAYETAKLGMTAARAVPEVAGKVLPTVAEMLTSDSPLLTQLRTTVARKLLKSALDSGAAKAAPAVVDAAAPEVAAEGSKLIPLSMEDFQDALKARQAAAGTKLVKPLNLTDELAQAAAEARANLNAPTPPARVTTPPPAELPAGYTPRTTVPKVAPKAAAPAPTPAPTAAPARPYFLKSPEQLADEAAATSAPSSAPRPYFLKSPEQIAAETGTPATAAKPSGSISINDLPESWKSRVGQDIFPQTGAESKEVVDAMRQELKARGLTVGQAITEISKNRNLSTQLRTQLLWSLSKMSAVQ